MRWVNRGPGLAGLVPVSSWKTIAAGDRCKAATAAWPGNLERGGKADLVLLCWEVGLDQASSQLQSTEV